MAAGLDPSLPRESDGFRLERELGRGGMGVVYEAIELESGRRVALKVLAEELAFNDEAFRRFRREARLAAGIGDSRCVFVYGAHRFEGAPAISMELVEGGTLQHKLASGVEITIDQAVRWTLDVVDGLAAAHAQGVLHRDIKPGNCFVDSRGDVKLGDFGLSRAVERDVNLTQTGQFIGSPLYAAPEQVRGRGVDERSDQYSVGALLYALLVGRPPHAGSNVGEVLARILTEDPPAPSAIRAGVPHALDKVVLKALSRDPARRHKDLAALRKALEPFIERVSPPEHLAGRFGAYIVDMALLVGLEVAMGRPALALLPIVGMAHGSLDPSVLAAVETFWDVGPALVYYGALEGAGGLTLGRWVVGSRVVSVATSQPSYRGALLRAAWLFAPPHLAQLGVQLALQPGGWTTGLGVMLHLAWWFVVFIPARAHNGWRGLHERFSRTRTTQLRFAPARRAALAPPRPGFAPAPQDRLGRYAVEGALEGRAHVLAGRDEELDREVLLVRAEHVGEARRNSKRSAQLRWIEAFTHEGARWQAWEAPGGAPATSCLEWLRQLEWPARARLALQLSEEMQAESAEQERPGLAGREAWIDRRGNLRLVDECFAAAPRPGGDGLANADGLAAAMRTLLLADEPKAELPVDLPGHAEAPVRALLQPQPSLSALRAASQRLQAALEGLHAPTPRQRLLQLALGVVLPAVLSISLGLTGYFSVLLFKSDALVAQAVQVRKDLVERRAELDAQAELDRRVLLREVDQRPVASLIFGDDELRAGLEDIWSAGRLAMPEDLDDDDVAAARLRFELDHPELAPASSSPWLKWTRPSWLLGSLAVGWLAFALVATLSSFVTRGGASLWIFGLRLRDRRGLPAPRFLCALRSFLSLGMPPLVALGAIWWIEIGWTPLVVAGWSLIGLVGLLLLLAVVHAFARTSISLVDRLLQTRIVPS
jgi:hypothetical protein